MDAIELIGVRVRDLQKRVDRERQRPLQNQRPIVLAGATMALRILREVVEEAKYGHVGKDAGDMADDFLGEESQS